MSAARALTEASPLPWWLIFSASQVTLWRECERKWGYRYIAGFKQPQTPAQQLGDRVDSGQLQPYLMGGKPFDLSTEEGQIANAMLPFLPKPMLPGLAVQKRIALVSPSGKWAFQGYIDLWLPDSRHVPNIPSYDGAAIPLVEDFKTTKSFRWQKTSEILKTDVQANLYATYAMAETGSDVVDLNWLTVTTVAPYKAKPAHLRTTIDKVAPQFEAIDRTGHELHDVRMAAPPPGADADTKLRFVLSLTPNPQQCDEFGGCPHRATCNLAPQQFRDSIVAKMKEKRSMTTNAASALARLKARKPGGDAVPAPAPQPAPEPEQQPLPFAGINPPEKDLPPAPPVGKVASIEPSEPAAEDDAAPAAEAPTEEKRGRGRPKGSKNKPKTETETEATGAAPVKSAEQIAEEMLDQDVGKAASAAIEAMVRAALADAFTRIANQLRQAA